MELDDFLSPRALLAALVTVCLLTLVVAEDFQPRGEELLSGVGADTRFDGHLVRDMGYQGPTADERFGAVLGYEHWAVMLNHGTVVDAPNETNVTTLISTSECLPQR